MITSAREERVTEGGLVVVLVPGRPAAVISGPKRLLTNQSIPTMTTRLVSTSATMDSSPPFRHPEYARSYSLSHVDSEQTLRSDAHASIPLSRRRMTTIDEMTRERESREAPMVSSNDSPAE